MPENHTSPRSGGKPPSPEERIKFALRISPDMQKTIKDLYRKDNCSSQNEFIEKAITFYTAYLSAKDGAQFLNKALASTIRGMLNDSEQHIVRLLFKLAVEIGMMTHVIAASTDVDDDTLHKLRKKCVEDVKRTHGSVSFDDAVEFQQG